MYNTFMYVLASQLTNRPLMSLQTGEAVAAIAGPILDPASLEVVGYLCHTPSQKKHLVLMVRDIRELARDCVIIDSADELTEADDIIRLKPLLEQNYSPIRQSVVTDLGRRLGGVEDYTINLESHRLQKLYVKQPIWRSWSGASLIIDRTQIIDVSPHQIVVREATAKAPLLAAEPLPEQPS